MCRYLIRNILPTAMACNCKANRYFASSRTSNARRFLIVGLGNSDLPHTRHSIGMTVLDHMAHLLGATWLKDRNVQGTVSHTTVATADGCDEVELVLLKSRLPMNLNGRSVRKAVETFGIMDADVYLVHDELDKVLGKCAIKEGGSARGHNGVKSVIECLNTSDITRLRFGIDRPSSKSAVASYVLQKFTKDERRLQSCTMINAIKTLLRHIETNSGVKFPAELLNERTTTKQPES
ncbi:putative peptidyl-tRNA hydrolase [Lamellibrachia satsuma]|nr:putative peptidyl-tRNA hydrolase [Lamellibrachia satsuma]